MESKTILVVTTISSPNKVLQKLAVGCQLSHWDFIIIGDTKTPSDFSLANSQYYDINAQIATELEYAKLCPTKHYARKNIGYLLAIQKGAEKIVETDDDNLPLDSFWQEKSLEIKCKIIDNGGWVNVYKYFSEVPIWPRGLPLDKINHPIIPYQELSESLSECVIQQGLANQNPDVDAIYRLILPLPQDFRNNVNLALGKDSWCPFNSQNTYWFPDAYPLMYLPAYCSFRMTDIWRSFIAQRICWENGWRILFHSPTVYQERNIHNLMQDFEQEIPGYLHNERIAKLLSEVQLKMGKNEILDNLRKCYDALIKNEIFIPKEGQLLEAWLKDINLVIKRK
ncbi:STELLO glycosyltransferase family protein [Okeania sp. SIO1F9]|uniref:STELLO glycosyltransferase family protein n=1 Tax=Okeania sp. SIO1F9 TaxID=2607813 RepID=UPI00144AFB23|nr:STELLO glycosyltransferase family protein [Okeania sp. SIO1F9]NET78593.1 DUF288 domain-containing protein [Okeania sp. SIO1F9]